MSKKPEKRGLGRGLSALMADIDASPVSTMPESRSETIKTGSETSLPIEKVIANPDQPRQDFKKEDLDELAASIAEKGIIQPIIVRPDPQKNDMYQIIAGERRWRAAQLAQLHEIPVVIRNMDDAEVLEVAIIENIQRADLNPVEEALGFKQLMDSFGHTQEKLAKGLGKSRSQIANTLRLLQLPDDVLKFLRSGQLSSGHARALITADNPTELAKSIVSKGLSVRETERLVKSSSKIQQRIPKTRLQNHRDKDADTIVLENDLSANLDMKVSIDHNENGGNGTVVLAYKTLDQLDVLCRLLSSNGQDESK